MNPFYGIGIWFIQALQSASPALDSVMRAFSFMGTIEFYLLLIPFLYWVVDASLGFRVMLLLIGTDFLTFSLKLLLHQPRPYWISGVKPLAEEASYGIPSAHASDSLAVWGYLAYRLKKRWLWVLSILIIILVGLSRMYLGVHFPTDVLAGWLVGLAAVILLIKGEGWLSPRLTRQSTTIKLVTGFGASLILILTGWLVSLLISPALDPAAWADYASQARSISHYFTLGGTLFGAVAGYTFMQRSAAISTRGAMGQLLLRFLVGMAVLLALYLSLDLLFSAIAPDETVIGMGLRYLRYAAAAFWTAFGAPWLFLKLKLAKPVSGA